MSLDREIEDLLAVDPSPDFVARVRQHVASQQAPRAWWFSWRLAPAGAGLAVVVMGALLWPASQPLTPAIEPTAVREAEQAVSVAVPVETSAPASSHPRTLTPSNRRASRVVLIQRGEAEALNLLLTRVREGALPDMTEALAAVDQAGPEWIDIPAVVIEPIATGEGE
jgi:hypothetical protein